VSLVYSKKLKKKKRIPGSIAGSRTSKTNNKQKTKMTSVSTYLNNNSIKTINVNEFLNWAHDKINVVWSTGCLSNSESLDSFDPELNESIEDYLNRIVNVVNNLEWYKGKKESDYSEHVFFFYNESSSDKRFDKYQEETMSTQELIECYLQTTN
jgi:hypothetical protein